MTLQTSGQGAPAASDFKLVRLPANGPANSPATAENASPPSAASSPRDLSHLPPPDTKRWVVSRKAIVVDAVRKGLLTLADACARYSLSEEEIRSWMKLSEKGGSRALRVTRLQDYRRKRAEGSGAITAA
jgi:hypothetical protein